jgi:hypothetical protein
MKWDKYSRVLAENPWLRAFVGNANVISAPHNYPEHKALAILKEWVRIRLNYVAFRPFESLDTASQNLSRGEGHSYEWVSYQVLFHLEGCSFAHLARSVAWKPDAREDETSVSKVLDHVVRWHQQYWAAERKLIFDAVIKTNGHDGCQSLEIYRFPENFTC